jgi:hypothetical protein
MHDHAEIKQFGFFVGIVLILAVNGKHMFRGAESLERVVEVQRAVVIYMITTEGLL